MMTRSVFHSVGVAALLVAASSPAMAQVTAPPADPVPPATPVDPVVAARQEAQQQLTGALARIARNGGDVQALTQAGRAALTLGDPRAALGFLARAEQLAPRDPVIKAALGATMVQMEDPQQAMRFFEAAIALGGLERAYLADRGLAYDLLGDQARAQADYAAAAQYAPSPEVTRRHAISLGISGQSEQAVQLLGPLLRTQDRAAWRSRAMIVAMNGRADEARQIAAATMPGHLASGLSPYFAMMERLTPQQLASAAHFGRFPSYEVVAGQPVRAARRVEVATAAPVQPPGRTNDGRRGRRVIASNGPAAPRNPERDRVVRQPVRPTPTPTPIPPVRVVDAAPPPAVPARIAPPPPGPAVAAVAAAGAETGAINPIPVPPAQPVMQQTIRHTIITPAPPPVQPPAQPAVVAARPMGPPDGGVGPGLTSLPPAPVPPAPVPPVSPSPPIPPAVTTVEIPPSVPPSELPAPAPPAIAVPTTVTPVPVAPPANTVVVSGWSLADMVGSITVPESERAVEEGALSIEELDAIATEQRRVAAAAAAEARRRATEEARAREASEAEARARTEREAEQRAEAEARRQHPARVWVQIATGADAGALAGDYRRFSQRQGEIFRGQTGHVAIWNRTRRLVVGPFASATAARNWLNRYTAAGGEGFVWNSEQGEEVTPLGRR